jgi:hypothetical protein
VSSYGIDDLSVPEKALWLAFPQGAEVDLRAGDPGADDPGGGHAWGEARVIRAGVIAALLLGAQPAEPGCIPVISLRGARIPGRLRLAFAEVRATLILRDCYFEERPDLYFTSLGYTSLRGSVIPGMVASNLQVSGHLRLTGSFFDGEVSLRGAKVTGGLLLDGARMRNPGGWSLDAERLQVGGDVNMNDGFSSEGEVRLYGARIGGSLALSGARLSNPSGLALSADNIRAEGSIRAPRAQVSGQVLLRHAALKGGLILSGAHLANRDAPALLGARLDADEGLFLDRLTCAGEVDFSHARIGRNVILAGADLDGAGGPAITATGITVEGPVDARDLKARGTVSLPDAEIAGPLRLQGACLENPGATALDVGGIRAGAAIDASGGFTARGTVNLTSARVASCLSLAGAVLEQPGGEALLCWRADAPELVLRPARVQGTVNLQHATVTILRDDEHQNWPDKLQLDGLTYAILEPRLPARDRLPWLARDPAGHQASPYEQLAAVYRSQGRDADARAVQLARQRRGRPALAWYARAWSYLQDITVGYGYRPGRAALWLLALLATGTAVFAAHPPPPFPGTSPPPFSPLIYTLNLIIPVIDFGQARAFNPHGIEQWLSYALIIAGWTLATTAATGIIRVLRRD